MGVDAVPADSGLNRPGRMLSSWVSVLWARKNVPQSFDGLGSRLLDGDVLEAWRCIPFRKRLHPQTRWFVAGCREMGDDPTSLRVAPRVALGRARRGRIVIARVWVAGIHGRVVGAPGGMVSALSHGPAMLIRDRSLRLQSRRD